jgi:ribosomal protein S18 acetylase RimI-like enzyme
MIATRLSHRRKGLGERLWLHFIDHCRQRGCTAMKAITSEGNAASIAFHQKLGMTANVVKDYSGKGVHRVVFSKSI